MGGYSNSITDSTNSSIIGGDCNLVATQSCNSSIVGGMCNIITVTSSYASIVGGYSNLITSISSYSSIIGGVSNTIGSTSSVGSTPIVEPVCETIVTKTLTGVDLTSFIQDLISLAGSVPLAMQIYENGTNQNNGYLYEDIVDYSNLEIIKNWCNANIDGMVCTTDAVGPNNSGATFITWEWRIEGCNSGLNYYFGMGYVIPGAGVGGSDVYVNFPYTLSSPSTCVCSNRPFPNLDVSKIGAFAAIILGGQNNLITTTSSDSSIVGGQNNTIATQSTNSAIISGNYNKIINSSINSSLLGGSGNSLMGFVNQSSIVGGNQNIIASQSQNSTIIGGQSNIIHSDSDNSAIVGGTNLVLQNESNLVYVPELKVENVDNNDVLTRILVWDYASSKKMMWREASTLGGDSLLGINVDEVAFGTGTGVTSSDYFTFNKDSYNFKVATSSNFVDSTNSVLVGGVGNNSIGGDRSSILGGSNNTIYTYTINSSIIGGTGNLITGTSMTSTLFEGTLTFSYLLEGADLTDYIDNINLIASGPVFIQNDISANPSGQFLPYVEFVIEPTYRDKSDDSDKQIYIWTLDGPGQDQYTIKDWIDSNVPGMNVVATNNSLLFEWSTIESIPCGEVFEYGPRRENIFDVINYPIPKTYKMRSSVFSTSQNDIQSEVELNIEISTLSCNVDVNYLVTPNEYLTLALVERPYAYATNTGIGRPDWNDWQDGVYAKYQFKVQITENGLIFDDPNEENDIPLSPQGYADWITTNIPGMVATYSDITDEISISWTTTINSRKENQIMFFITPEAGEVEIYNIDNVTDDSLSGGFNPLLGYRKGGSQFPLWQTNEKDFPCDLSGPYYSSNSSIIGGRNNILSLTVSDSSIIGGNNNLMVDRVYSSNIIGGDSNQIKGGSCTLDEQLFTFNSSIISGTANQICNSLNSFIIGGNSNFVYGSTNSGIISGKDHQLTNSCQTVIIGGEGLEINDTDNKVIVPSMIISPSNDAHIRLLPSTPTTPQNGDIWFNGSNIYIRVSGVTKRFNLLN
jgi:hypothetical protein